MTGKSAGGAGAEVVEIERLARGYIGIAWSTKASPGSVCTASGSRNTIQTNDDHWPRAADDAAPA
jgi:hypothetical protein